MKLNAVTFSVVQKKQNTFDLFIIKEIWGLDQEGFGDLNEGPII